MKKNLFMQEMIQKEDGYCIFIGNVLVYGEEVPKLIFAHCNGKDSVTYYDFNTFTPINSVDITKIETILNYSSKHIIDIVTLDIFYSHSEKKVFDTDKNKSESMTLTKEKWFSYNKKKLEI